MTRCRLSTQRRRSRAVTQYVQRTVSIPIQRKQRSKKRSSSSRSSQRRQRRDMRTGTRRHTEAGKLLHCRTWDDLQTKLGTRRPTRVQRELMQLLMAKQWVIVGAEVYLKCPNGTTGYADFICRHPRTGLHVVELKTSTRWTRSGAEASLRSNGVFSGQLMSAKCQARLYRAGYRAQLKSAGVPSAQARRVGAHVVFVYKDGAQCFTLLDDEAAR